MFTLKHHKNPLPESLGLVVAVVVKRSFQGKGRARRKAFGNVHSCREENKRSSAL